MRDNHTTGDPILPYIVPSKARQYSYFVIPRMLICDPAFSELDCTAKLIYSIMLNRLSLSAENPKDFTDREGRLYIIYPVDEIASTLQISRPTVIKMVNQLAKMGLIVKKRQGQGKPTLIYVMDFTAVVEKSFLPSPSQGNHMVSETEKSKKLTSRGKKAETQEVRKFDSSNIDSSYIDCSYLPSVRLYQNNSDGGNDRNDVNSSCPLDVQVDGVEGMIEGVKEQIEFDILVERRGPEVAKAVLSLIIGVLARAGPVSMGKNQYPEQLVKQRFKSLTFEEVDFALEKLFQTPGVRNQTAYLTTLLFNGQGGAELEAASLFSQEELNKSRYENRNQFRFF